jgi:hypothetical protein
MYHALVNLGLEALCLLSPAAPKKYVRRFEISEIALKR